MDLIAEKIDVIPRKRGRPKGSTKAFARAMVWQSKGVGPLKANDVLLMANERRQWERVFASEDERVILAALTFLVSMRDGRPAQQISVNSFHLSVSAEDIAQAREIVRELRGENSPSIPQRTLGEGADDSADDSLMLLDDEGGNLGGVM